MVFVGIIGLIGCNNGMKDNQSDEKIMLKSNVKELSIATGGIGGTYFDIGAAIAVIITQDLEDTVVSPLSTGASIANLTLLKNGDVDLILAASNSNQRAYFGTPPFEEAYSELRAIASLYSEMFHFITKVNQDIDSISDIKGLRISVGPKEGGTSRSAQEIIEAHGIDFNKDIEVKYLSFSEAVFALEAGQIDVAVVATGIPNSIVNDIADVIDIKLLKIDEDKFNSFMDKQPYMFIGKIPAGIYKGINYDILTASTPALLVTTTEMDNDLVYRVTKALFNSPDILRQAHSQGQNIRLNNALQGISIPLHEGSKQYYLEQGINFDEDGR